MFDNSAQVHLYLNHFSVIGIIFVLLVSIMALILKSKQVFITALVLCVFVGLITIPVYNSGEGAEQIVKGLEGTNEEFINDHEEIALYALILTELAAVMALAGLIFYRGDKKYPVWFKSVFIFILITGSIILGITAHKGGLIKHIELQSGYDPSS